MCELYSLVSGYPFKGRLSPFAAARFAFSYSFPNHLLVYSWLLYSVFLCHFPLRRSPSPPCRFLPVCTILISTLSIVGSTHPIHAHGLNKILRARDQSMQLCVCKYDIFRIANMWAYKEMCTCGGGALYFITQASSIFPNAISSM